MMTMINTRPQGALPSTTEVNPKEHCQAIMLKSGKEVEQPIRKIVGAEKSIPTKVVEAEVSTPLTKEPI